MLKRGFFPIAVVAAAIALMVSMVAGGQGVVAQDTAATPDGMMAEMAHPGHIHTGTCDAVGDVVYPLEDLTAPEMMGSPEADADMATDDDAMGTPDADAATDDMDDREVVASSVTTVEASLDDILAAEHVVNFHESAENMGNYIACGALIGSADDEGMLEIMLDEQNDSGLEGHAVLVDGGDGTVEVTVELMMVEDDDMATPDGTPIA